MILVDTSVWIDHLHRADPALVELLEHGDVLSHPLVIGELALGSLHNREQIIQLLGDLPRATVVTADEVLTFIQSRSLHGRGLSLVDVHLLASTVVTPEALLWTRDRRLHEAASELSVALLP